MKTVALRDAKQQLSDYVAQAQGEQILITKHGRPAALVLGVEGKDFEDVIYMTNPRFWEVIRSRRRSRPIPWRLAKRRLRS